MAANPVVAWPEGKSFAFTVFDDADSQTLEKGRAVYSLLADLGFRTTKSVWPIRGKGIPSDIGATCEDAEHRRWVQGLQGLGFEIGYHMATSHTSLRADTLLALEQFARYFGHYPVSMANHYFCDENIYFGEARVTGLNRLAYNLVTLFRNRNKFRGHVPGDPLFWGDLCRERIKYVRNFVFAGINTLKLCPYMPYHDPLRPYVNYWFASSEGADVNRFNQCLAEANQDRLEAEGGAAILYAHFGLGFYEDGALNARFRSLMARLSQRNGWFVPVSTLLDYLLEVKGPCILRNRDRRRLERAWLLHKMCRGTA